MQQSSPYSCTAAFTPSYISYRRSAPNNTDGPVVGPSPAIQNWLHLPWGSSWCLSTEANSAASQLPELCHINPIYITTNTQYTITDHTHICAVLGSAQYIAKLQYRFRQNSLGFKQQTLLYWSEQGEWPAHLFYYTLGLICCSEC